MGKKKKTQTEVIKMRSDERLAVRIAREILVNYDAQNVLDIGCGDGVVESSLNKDTLYRGLDISDASIYEQKPENPSLRYISPKNIPAAIEKEGPWDIILLLDVLEHTRDFTDLFDAALMHTNSHIIVSLPNELFLLDRLRMLLGHELNAHSLDRLGDPEGFKHQFIINTKKAADILEAKAMKNNFFLEKEYLRELITKNPLMQPCLKLIKLFTKPNCWSMGSVFVFSRIQK